MWRQLRRWATQIWAEVEDITKPALLPFHVFDALGIESTLEDAAGFSPFRCEGPF
jgi:hypothetical protein